MQSYIKFISILMMLYSSVLSGKNRARDLGIPFDGVPGTNNAITDVAGVTVGHSTIIQGSGKKILGKDPAYFYYRGVKQPLRLFEWDPCLIFFSRTPE
jgi:hypothetical protein